MSHAALAVVVVAAGTGSRLAAGVPKAFVDLDGRTMLEHALDAIPDDARVVVVVAPTRRDATAETLAGRAEVVAGGDTRQASVAAGLAALTDEVRVVLVHDAARPFMPRAVFDRVRAAVAATGAGVVPALPVADTVKRVDSDGSVVETVPRDELRAVQTPQGFPRDALVAAYAHASQEYTDDAALFQANGGRVIAIEGDADGAKITTAGDLAQARRHLRVPSEVTGVGVDAHAFDAGDALWLGGLLWPGEPGLSGHSDGDVALHAICDALLTAGGLGDIGGVFGTDDPRFAGSRSDVFVAEALRLLAERGLAPVSVAVEIVAERPRIAPRRLELETHLTGLIGAPVRVAGTTSDRLGITGRGEGIAAVASALVRRRDPAGHAAGRR